VFRVGLTDAEASRDTCSPRPTRSGCANPYTSTPHLRNENVATGRWLNIETSGVSATPKTVLSVYNNTDNGKYAFALYVSPSNNAA
jgi:hypothetical protein